MQITKDEQYKLNQLQRSFTVNLSYSAHTGLWKVQLSNCWLYLGHSADKALDGCYKSIKKNKYQNNSDVKKDYEEGKKYVN